MATFGIVHRFPRGTREQYEKTIEIVYPDGGKALPEGELLHLAGPSLDGWLVMAVYVRSLESCPNCRFLRWAVERPSVSPVLVALSPVGAAYGGG